MIHDSIKTILLRKFMYYLATKGENKKKKKRFWFSEKYRPYSQQKIRLHWHEWKMSSSSWHVSYFNPHNQFSFISTSFSSHGTMLKSFKKFIHFIHTSSDEIGEVEFSGSQFSIYMGMLSSLFSLFSLFRFRLIKWWSFLWFLSSSSSVWLCWVWRFSKQWHWKNILCRWKCKDFPHVFTVPLWIK